ncbi:SLC13 family permease [Rhodovibrionaceae bacterium A322]
MTNLPLDQIAIFLILGGALLLFIWGRLRYDLVAVIALLVGVLSGVVPADEAFFGFGHPAVVTVAAILILSRGLKDSGIIEFAGQALEPLSGRATLQVVALAGVTAAASAFMNNVGALALMLPIAIHAAKEAKRPASQVLMPVSFASLLGGLITLIGTPPNIIIANYRAAEAGTAFGMFAFAPVGLLLALVGVAFVALLGWRLLPNRNTDDADSATAPLLIMDEYITEARLPEGNPFVGLRLIEIENLGQGSLSVVALVRGKDRILAPSGFFRLNANDILILEADTDTLQQVVEKSGLEMVGTAELSQENLHSDRVSLVEAVVAPGSRLDGRTANAMRLHTRYGVNLLALSRQGAPIRERLGQVRLDVGDVLLLHGERVALPDVLRSLGCLPLAERELEIGSNRRDINLIPPLVFLIAILAVVGGFLQPHIAFVSAAVAMVVLGRNPLRDIYEAVDWPIVVLLGAMIPLGLAFDSTGGSATIASPILALSDHVPIWLLLGLLMLITMLLSDVMNNAATAVLMAPIGATIAKGLGVSIDPFLMAVAVGASSTYLTPIGHQSNLLVMGPGGYRFSDYWRMGLPLDALILLVGVPAILWIWPV